MKSNEAKVAILNRGKPIAWFARREDADEMLCQLQWEAGQRLYSIIEIRCKVVLVE